MAFARRVVGCYALIPGPWRADSVEAGSVSTAETPLRFRLTDRLLDASVPHQSVEAPMYQAIEEPVTGATTSQFTYWARFDATNDTIVIGVPLPPSGVSLELAPDGHDLSGWVVATTDAVPLDGPSEVRRRVRARRTACPRAR
jgi:hypothetical protein